MEIIKKLLLALLPPIIIVVIVLCMIFGPIELLLIILAVFAAITIAVMLSIWFEFITNEKLVESNHLEQIVDVEIRMLNGVHSLEEGKPFWKGTYNELRWFARYFYKLGLEEK